MERVFQPDRVGQGRVSPTAGRSAVMAIGSLPANPPVLWQPDSRHLDHMPSLRQASANEDRRAKAALDEPAPEFRDSSVSRASICSLGGAELNSLPVSPCFQQAWSERVSACLHVSTSGQSWQSCEIPLPSSFLHSASRDAAGHSPLFEKWEQQDLGRSPLLLSLFATLPRSSATCRHVSDQLHALSRWGAWMQRFGTASEYRQAGSFFRSLQGADPRSSQQHIDAAFPRRLRKKYPEMAETFVRSMRLLFLQQPSSSKAPWSTEYLTLWTLYAEVRKHVYRVSSTLAHAGSLARGSTLLTSSLDDARPRRMWSTIDLAQSSSGLCMRDCSGCGPLCRCVCLCVSQEGLTLHHKIRAMCEAKQTADPSEFLVCRALTSGFPHLALLAAKNTMTDPPEAGALNAVYPLLALGSMLAATFSDLFLASRQLAHKSESVSALQMYDDDWATVVHNSLLVLFHEEADTLLSQALPLSFPANASSGLARHSPAVRSQVVCLVGTIKAALHGLVVWYQTVPAFRNHPEATVDLAFAFASSFRDATPHAPASAATLAPESKPLTAQESDPLPPWVTDAVDSAIGRLVQLLRSSAPFSTASPH